MRKPDGSDSGVPFPRKTLLPSAAYHNHESAFHVTLTAHAKVAAFPPEVRDGIWAQVVEQDSADRVDLLAACLMPDHLHWLVRPQSQDLLSFIRNWKSFTTKLAWGAGHTGTLWQPKMWDRTIRNAGDLASTIGYIIENPVRAGLVSQWEDWQWTWLSDGTVD